MSVRITYGPWGETLAEMCDAARRAEEAGAEVIWCPELHRSATVTAAALGQAARRARVGTAIALAFTRSPMTLALEALDLDELTGGRFILGVGTGVRELNERWHNARFGRPAPHLRETVRNLRAFWAKAGAGEPIDLDGEHEPMHLRGYRRPFPVRRAVPVYLAAMGPALTRLAGQVGDGWISHELCSPAYLTRHSTPWLEAGLDSSGRRREELDVVVSALCAVDTDGRRALALAGTAEEVRERLAAYDGLADTIKLTPPTHGIGAEESRSCQEQIIEMIAQLAGGTR